MTDRSRADFHAALDDLLDAAAVDGGKLDPAAFWAFTAGLAEGRGIAEELELAAGKMIAVNQLPEDNADLWRRWQFAVLFNVLGRLSAEGNSILPQSFNPAAFRAVMANMVNPKPGIHPDLLGLGTTRGGDGAMFRAARRQLVMAVYFVAERDGLTLADARDRVFPPAGRGNEFHRTWQGWQREVADAKKVEIDQIGLEAKAAANGNADPAPYDLAPEMVADLWRWGYRPR